MTILAIDPGTEKSGWVLYDGVRPIRFGWDDNSRVRSLIRSGEGEFDLLIIEQVPTYGSGMAVAAEIYNTCYEIGRFIECDPRYGFDKDKHFVTRTAAKVHVCGTPRATDANVACALKDRWGGQDVGVGGVKCRRCKGKGWFGPGRPTCLECNGGKWLYPPGPLYGMKYDHMWAALAVAVTWHDQNVKEDRDE